MFETRVSLGDDARFCFLAIAIALSSSCRAVPEKLVEPATKMPFVLIHAGTFHRPAPVTISHPFYLGTREVTQREWRAIMGANPSHFRGDDLPVEEVNWFEVHEFIRRLNVRDGGGFRLPTEAEWEYACRAATATAYAFGDVLSTADANYDGRYPLPNQEPGEYRGRTTPAGSLRANAWGLYDMHGNVWEWCEDDFCPYATTATTDPIGRCNSGLKVIRGGSWYFNADSARSSLRYTHRPQDRGFSLGFRLARDVR